MARILIVDDEKSIRRTLSEFLRADGHEVGEAENAEVALQLLRERPFDLVVTDIILPRVSGVELLRSIRAAVPDILVVMMTGEPTVETASESLRAGATDYLFKPISKAAIQRVVANAERLKRLEDAKGRLEAENRSYQENLERLVEERTQQLRATEKRASELSRFNQAALDALTAHICILAEDGTVLGVNEAWRMFAATDPPAPANVGVGANYLAACESAEGEHAVATRDIARGIGATARGEMREFACEYPCHSPGAPRWFVVRATRFRGSGPIRIVVSHMDITVRKQAQARLDCFAHLGNSLSSTTIPQQAAQIMADAALELLGWDACYLSLASLEAGTVKPLVNLDTIDGQRILVSLNAADYRPTPMLRRVMTEGPQLILRERPGEADPELILTGDVTRRSLSLMFVPIRREGKAIGIFSTQSYQPHAYDDRDLETLQALADHAAGALVRLQAEADLERNRTELSTIFEHSPVMMCLLDSQHRLRRCNHALAQFADRSAAELPGLSIGDLLGCARVDDVPTACGSAPHCAACRLLDVVQQTFQSGRECRQVEGTCLVKQGDQTKTHQLTCSTSRMEVDGQQMVLLCLEDVTEQKLTQAKLLRAQRVETIGGLASGIAHDLNNILTPIVMCAPLLQTEDSVEDRRELVQTIESSAHRAVGIVKQLLTFARGKEGLKSVLQARHLIRDMAKLVRETFPRSIQVEELCASDLWPVIADATQLHQVVLNLCMNARDAMPSGGKLTLRADNVVLDRDYVATHKEAGIGPFIRIQVEDTGTGIPDSAQDHIFDSFFTTKREGEGTGLGLTTVQGIVKDHKGFVTFITAPGKGTTFIVHLPATPVAPSTAEQVQTRNAAPRGQGDLILVVDDEPAIRDTTRRSLERCGYHVIQAGDGIQALEQFTHRRDEIKAVVTDFMMPLMDGVTLCCTIRALSPDTPLIVSSGGLFGNSGGKALETLQGLGICRILHKPHNMDVLLQTLSEVLREPPDKDPTKASA
jgi:signal transduction histidine kinase/DNA-binding response OmpR family regulator